MRRGPDTGLSLDGLLALGLSPAGAVDHGQLVKADGTTVPVVGQVTGRAVNLLFTLGRGKTIYRVGTAQHPLAGCQPGTLVGPAAGDSGDWALVANSPALADACSRCLAANYCAGRPGTQPCQDCITNYCS